MGESGFRGRNEFEDMVIDDAELARELCQEEREKQMKKNYVEKREKPRPSRTLSNQPNKREFTMSLLICSTVHGVTIACAGEPRQHRIGKAKEMKKEECRELR